MHRFLHADAIRPKKAAKPKGGAATKKGKKHAKAAAPAAMYLNGLLTIPSCMAGLPGLSIPCGLSAGLPVGLQLVGPQFGENTLFKVGHALERALGFDGVPERLRA